jgi:hypothetical protein
MAEINMPEEKDTIENARVGYQVAVSMITSESDAFWSKFNTLLLANSIVLPAFVLTLTLQSSNISKILLIGLPLLGIVLCIFWFSIINRSYGYVKYWTISAHEIEEQYLKGTFNIFRRGADLSDGKTVYFRLDGENSKETPHQMSYWGRLRTGQSSYIIISFFFVIYIILLRINI